MIDANHQQFTNLINLGYLLSSNHTYEIIFHIIMEMKPGQREMQSYFHKNTPVPQQSASKILRKLQLYRIVELQVDGKYTWVTVNPKQARKIYEDATTLVRNFI